MEGAKKHPRISMFIDDTMVDVPWESLPDPDPLDLQEYFMPVRISPRALDMASKIIPVEYYREHGLHAFLLQRADLVFRKLPSSQREGVRGKLKYIFEYDKGPILKTISLL